jgi:hypothetical protein
MNRFEIDPNYRASSAGVFNADNNVRCDTLVGWVYVKCRICGNDVLQLQENMVTVNPIQLVHTLKCQNCKTEITVPEGMVFDDIPDWYDGLIEKEIDEDIIKTAIRIVRCFAGKQDELMDVIVNNTVLEITTRQGCSIIYVYSSNDIKLRGTFIYSKIKEDGVKDFINLALKLRRKENGKDL